MLHTLAKRALTLSTFAMLFASCASSSAEVSKKSQPNERRCGSKTRTHYIAADSVAWNYAPAGKNLISGAAFTDDENVFVGRRPGRIGSVYTKSMYREYTDSTFTKLVTRPAA